MVEIKTRKQQKQFVDFPLKLYKNCKYFAPPIYGDEMAVFKKNYMYYDQSEAVYYLAYVDGKVVGRISGILQKASNVLHVLTQSMTKKWRRRCLQPWKNGRKKRVWRKLSGPLVSATGSVKAC